MKNSFFLIIFLFGLLACNTNKKIEQNTTEEVADETKKATETKESKTSQKVDKADDEENNSLKGVYFCATTQEIFVIEADEKKIAKIFAARAKRKFKEQKITSQSKLEQEMPLDPSYTVNAIDELIFGNYPSGQAYFILKAKDKEDLVFFRLKNEITNFNSNYAPNLILAEALAGKYGIVGELTTTELYQTEMRYSFSFKKDGKESAAIVNEDLSVEMTLPLGKINIKDGMGVLMIEVLPKGQKSYTLERR